MPNYNIIGGDQKEYGPATADELRQWIAEGRLSPRSMAQIEGSSEWKPLSTFDEFTEALHAQSTQVALAGGSAPSSPATWEAAVLARTPQVGVGRCLAGAWKLMAGNFGLLFAACFLVWTIGMVCQFVPVLSLLTGVLFWVFKGVLYGGLYLVFLKRIRGESAAVGDVFAAFGLAVAQLLLAGVVSSLLSSIGMVFCLLPGIYLAVAWVFSVPLAADKGLEFWPAMELSRKVVTRVWFPVCGLLLLAFLPYILVTLLAQAKIYISMFPIIQNLVHSTPPDFTRMSQMMVQVAKNSLPLVILTKVVLLFNMPFALGALMYAYETLFGTRSAPQA